MTALLRTALATVLALTGCGSSCAQAAPAGEAQIRVLLDRWAKAMHDRDLDAVMSIYRPGADLVVYGVSPPLKLSGYDAYRKDCQDLFAGSKGPIGIEYRDLTIQADDKVAFAYGLERLSVTTTGGQPVSVWIRFTSGFRKFGGRWYDVHDHASVPADFTTGKAALDLTP